MAFALANQGKVEDARKYYSRIDSARLTTFNHVTWLATAGLLEYRSGNIDMGRIYYERAIAYATDKNYKELVAKASVYHLLEEVNAGNVEAEKTRQELMMSINDSKITNKAFLAIIYRLKHFRKFDGALVSPIKLGIPFLPVLRSITARLSDAIVGPHLDPNV
jgi:tetratricopeptide (TPR) repeat protein